jgi:hypothetical protein
MNRESSVFVKTRPTKICDLILRFDAICYYHHPLLINYHRHPCESCQCNSKFRVDQTSVTIIARQI